MDESEQHVWRDAGPVSPPSPPPLTAEQQEYAQIIAEAMRVGNAWRKSPDDSPEAENEEEKALSRRTSICRELSAHGVKLAPEEDPDTIPEFTGEEFDWRCLDRWARNNNPLWLRINRELQHNWYQYGEYASPLFIARILASELLRQNARLMDELLTLKRNALYPLIVLDPTTNTYHEITKVEEKPSPADHSF